MGLQKYIIPNSEFQIENSKFLNKSFHLFDFKNRLNIPKNFFFKEKVDSKYLKFVFSLKKKKTKN